MKANEAPEKIYIFENPILDFTKLSDKQSDNDIEYTRTDVIIERACSWLRNYVNPITGTYLFNEDIEKFRKAMKGEEVWK